MVDYKFLFPFEKIPKGSKVIIYGGGEVGWEYLRQLLITKYAEVIGVADRRAGNMEKLPVRVFLPSEINSFVFDYIVLAFRAEVYYKSVAYELQKMGIKKNKIVYISPRIEPDYDLVEGGGDIRDFVYAHEQSDLSIAVKVGAAIGDNIIQKNFIKAITQIVPAAKVDIYSPVSDSYLPWLYNDCTNVNAFIKDAGSLYMRQCTKYDFSMQIWVFAQIDYINENKLSIEYKNFYKKIKILERKIKETDMNYKMPLYNLFARSIKQGKNAYTFFDYDGEFEINKKVDIFLDEKYEPEFKQMNFPYKYITINYGNGITTVNEKLIAKQWPREHFEELIRKLKDCYPDIAVIQLGARGAYELKGIDKYVLGKTLELAAYVLKNAVIHIDIEGGLVHLATQLGTKCIVLFGPTQKEYFGYKENINIKAGNCHDCYGMYLDQSKCARHMEKPECMYSITPEMVMKSVREHLEIALKERYKIN